MNDVPININVYILLVIFVLFLKYVIIRKAYAYEFTGMRHRTFRRCKKSGINGAEGSKNLFFKNDWAEGHLIGSSLSLTKKSEIYADATWPNRKCIVFLEMGPGHDRKTTTFADNYPCLLVHLATNDPVTVNTQTISRSYDVLGRKLKGSWDPGFVLNSSLIFTLWFRKGKSAWLLVQ